MDKEVVVHYTMENYPQYGRHQKTSNRGILLGEQPDHADRPSLRRSTMGRPKAESIADIEKKPW